MLQKSHLVVFLLLIPAIIFAQDKGKRPKIGVVLSGGGAKGMAHIGALKVMEEAGIKPDYITGTSMGSLIAGLYAIGYSADELEEVAKSVNWDEILTNKVSLDNIVIEEKSYYDRYIMELPVDGFNIGLPQGAISGQKLSELFSRLTTSVHRIDDFSQFPIPYACIGADILTGEAVVLNAGSLPTAMRASMAIPSVFTPIVLDDRLLVDGGVFVNFPVQQVIDMGADIVIGVNVGSGETSIDDMRSMVDVLVQTSFIGSTQNVEKQIELCDVLITPDLTGYSTSSFDEATGIIARGEAAAREQFTALQHVLDSVLAYGEPLNNIEKVPFTDSIYVEKITIIGNEHISDGFIKDKLRIKENKLLSLDNIEERVDVLYGTRYFDKITYEIFSGEEGEELLIYINEGPQGRLKFALHYDTENGAGLNLNLTRRNLGLSDSRLVVEADIAETPRADVNYLKYIGERHNLAAVVGGRYVQDEIAGSLGESRINDAIFSNELYSMYGRLQSTFSKDFTLGVQYFRDYAHQSPKIGGNLPIDLDSGLVFNFEVDWIDKIKYRSDNLEVFFRLNTQDKRFFPTRGWDVNMFARTVFNIESSLTYSPKFYEDLPSEITDAFEVAGQSFVAYDSYNLIGADISWNLRITDRLSFLSRLAGYHFEGDQAVISNDQYNVGGFNPLGRNTLEFWGAEAYQYSLDDFLYTKAGIQYRFFKSIYVQGIVNLLSADGSIEEGMPDKLVDAYGYGISLSYYSLLGPMTVAIAKGNSNDNLQAFLSLGFTF